MKLISFKLYVSLTICAWCSVINLANAHDGVDYVTLIKAINPSIVGVGTHIPLRSPRVSMEGTGFIFYNGKYAITNAHVLPKPSKMKPKERIVIMLGRGERPEIVFVEVVKIDQQHDLALLKLERAEPAPYLKMGSTRLLDEGSEVVFTGFPLGAVMGLYPVTHRGIISAITPVIRPQVAMRYLDVHMLRQSRHDVYQLDAVAYPGSSGSPVLDIKTGRVVAVVNSVAVKKTKEKSLNQPSGITFAIPAIHLHNLLVSAGVK